MAESSAPGHATNLAKHSRSSPPALRVKSGVPLVRHALATLLGVMLVQLSVASALMQLLGRFGSTAARSGMHPDDAPADATAEALERVAPQAIAPLPTSAPTDRPPPGTPLLMPLEPELVRACPADMVLVEGDYCRDVLQSCARWLDDEALPFARCAEFHQPARCLGPRQKLRFCMDRYEYTAKGSDLPINYQSFERSSALCKSLGKRLCTETEWTFACEGEDMRPYPYGFSRQAKCNQDRSDLYEVNPHRQVLADRRERADARPECVSPFGIYNLAGNMDESVLREGREHVTPFRNALKGGWWMAARNRCRPATTAHDDYYNDIQVGTRCCSSASG